MIASKIPEDQDPSAGDRKIWLYVAIGATVFTVLLFLLTLLMIKRIKIAVAVIKVIVTFLYGALKRIWLWLTLYSWLQQDQTENVHMHNEFSLKDNIYFIFVILLCS